MHTLYSLFLLSASMGILAIIARAQGSTPLLLPCTRTIRFLAITHLAITASRGIDGRYSLLLCPGHHMGGGIIAFLARALTPTGHSPAEAYAVHLYALSLHARAAHPICIRRSRLGWRLGRGLLADGGRTGRVHWGEQLGQILPCHPTGLDTRLPVPAPAPLPSPPVIPAVPIR